MSEQNLPPEFFREIWTFTLRVCTPIYWHDRQRPFPKDVRGASCFFLRFERGVIGITADHVVDAYHAARAQTPTLVCQVRLAPFDLDMALIDRDQRLDLATFAVSEDEVSAIDAVVIDCRESWPPPKPDHMRLASFAGFPEIIRVVREDRSAEFNAYGALPAVEDVTDSEIIFTYDPARDRPLYGAAPPVGFNLSGCSGGPVLTHGIWNGHYRSFPVGMLVGGPKKDESKKENEDGTSEKLSFDIIRARRIHFVKTNGTLEKLPAAGWLPSAPITRR